MHKGKKLAPFSEEHKDKIRKAHLGKKHSEETKEKIRKSLIQAFANPLTKIKLSEAMTGRLWWNNGVIAKLSKTQPGPDFIRGRLSKNINL